MKARYCFILCCVVAAVSVLVSLNAAAADPKQVVVLHSYGQDFKPWSDYAKALRQELDRQSPWPLNIQRRNSVRCISERPFFQGRTGYHCRFWCTCRCISAATPG
jgi:hypothetical protein